MKIIHILGGRGNDAAMADTLRGLQKAGIEQLAIVPKAYAGFAALDKAGVRVTLLPDSFMRKLALAQRIRREKPDIVQIWDHRAAGLLSPHLPYPVIGYLNTLDDPRDFTACSHFVGATKYITTHAMHHDVETARAFTIHAPFDAVALPPIDRAGLATPKNAKVLLTISRLHPYKNLDVLLAMLATMPDCYSWLAGDGPYQKMLQKEAMRLGINERVRFLGKRSDHAALLRGADMCILPSRQEQSLTPVVEAWAAGTPLIVSDEAPIAAHIEDGLNGILVPADNAEKFVTAARMVLADETLRQRLIAQGYAAYIKTYTSEAVARQWMELYRKLAG